MKALVAKMRSNTVCSGRLERAAKTNRWADLSNRKVSMFKELVEKWEVAYLAKGARLSAREKLIVRDFAQWLEFEAAQHGVQADANKRKESINYPHHKHTNYNGGDPT